MAYLAKGRQSEIDNEILDLQLQHGVSYPDNTLIEIANALKVQVVQSAIPDFEGNRVKGIIKWPDHTESETEPTIYIQNELNPTTALFTLAHELGHFVLHKNSNRLRVDLFDYSRDDTEAKEESEANYFAASLLVPELKLKKVLSVSSDIKRIAEYFGVSIPVIENRIKWIKMN